MGDTITRIGRYEISRQLVETALASVYDAFDPVERKPVAIRVPRTSHHRTGEVTLGLRHPGLMNVLSYEQSQGEAFLVLEPFQGTALDSLIHAGRKMEPAEVVALLRQLASVLDYAHLHGSLHGSLHPSSILLNDRNEIKVLDLGAPGSVGRNASPEQLLRAVHFLSPECIRDLPMDGRSDQFSLAVLAHGMLTGDLPFAGKPLGVMFRIAYLEFERSAIRDLPPAAQRVLERALSKRPEERYASCGEMVESLASALLRTAPAPTRVASAAEFPAVQSPAERSGVARYFSLEGLKYFGVTFAVCALLLGAIFYFLLPKAPPRPVPLVAPAAGQPSSSQPVAGQPPAGQPTGTQPSSSQPATSQPSSSRPASTQPAAGQPPASQPSSTQPVASQPVAAAPAPPPGAKARAESRKTTKRRAPELELKPAEPKIIRE
jgi:serine/threonine-protein kinase